MIHWVTGTGQDFIAKDVKKTDTIQACPWQQPGL
jgi:hypothetical protein